ncbi:MAG: hypothetical protein KKG59_03570 [Nanoarchaeota archaeon]|nr:hypothetical protein [Nanoarchaeota archaeon]
MQEKQQDNNWDLETPRTALVDKRTRRITRIPGLTDAQIQNELDIAFAKNTVRYGDPENVMAAKPGTELDEYAFLLAAEYIQKYNPNHIDPKMFPGSYELEREVIGMFADLLRHPDPDNALGFFTGGGTASIAQTLWTFRNKFYCDLESVVTGKDMTEVLVAPLIRRKGIRNLYTELGSKVSQNHDGVVLAPLDIHFALDKSVDFAGMGTESGIVRYDLDENFDADIDSIARTAQKVYASGREILALYAVAGDVGKGRFADCAKIEEVLRDMESKSFPALKHRPRGRPYQTPIVVDAAQQFMTALLRGDEDTPHIPDWDFAVDGVQALLIDLHKTDMATYGSSILFYRSDVTKADGLDLANYTQNNAPYLHHEGDLGIDADTRVTDALIKTCPTFETSRGALGAVSTWIYMNKYGMPRLFEGQKRVVENVEYISKKLSEPDSPYELMCQPQSGIVSFRVKGNIPELNKTVYDVINGAANPQFTISHADHLGIRTEEQMREYEQRKSQLNKGEKLNGHDGLYVQVMPHMSHDQAQTLVDVLYHVGKESVRRKAA